ncbi:cytochrome P450 [Diplogelasinospora grovesii]|uniref:Cytochrome P450 n=1 Tax=Diplogelasinospora grovesii TaxID=303347 RepID=A0AAN6MYH4_9PEZI|nr:cytochrome P450 [Diplogelasinospora grovesii]
MHPVIVLTVATGCAHLAVVSVLSATRRWASLRRLSQTRGCKAARAEQVWDVLGILKIISAVRAVLSGNILGYMDDLWATRGETYASSFLGQKVIFTCDAAAVKQVLVSRWGDYYAAKGLRKHMFRYLAPGAIGASDGQPWKQLRGMWRVEFSSLNDMFDIASQEDHFQKLVRLIPKDGGAVDMQALFKNLLIDLIMAIFLGEPVGCLVPERQSADKKRFVECLDIVAARMAKEGFLGPASFFYFAGRRETLQASAYLREYVERIIRRKLEERQHRINNPNSNPVPGKCVLESLMERTTDVAELRTHVLSLMVGANDSVGSFLSSTIWALSRDARVFAKLRASILDNVGFEAPTFQQLKSFPYLNQVLHEVLRLYPPLPFNARIANKDTWLGSGGGPDGKDPLLVKCGQCVRSVRNFGDDALEFWPERWEHLRENTPGFFPFLMGPRQCLGQQFAMLQATYATIRLLQTFSQVESRDELPFQPTVGLSLVHRNGVSVACTPDPRNTAF